MPLSVDARLVPRADVAAREISDGAVLVNMGSGACFELNRVGFEIWKALGEQKTMREICEKLQRRYSIDMAVVTSDLLSLVESLVGAKLVKVLDEPSTSESEK